MYIDTHTHMISRTTDDYELMAKAGIVACIEPAFWLGQPRTNVGSYIDYLSTIVGWERFRAGQFGLRHYCTVGLNSKEANNEELAEAIFPAGALWFAWPKRSSGVPTDITEDTLREVALPLGLVDNKVCAISEIWSGLRVVWRKELRRPSPT